MLCGVVYLKACGERVGYKDEVDRWISLVKLWYGSGMLEWEEWAEVR
jgi:hypothetical protein